MLHIHHIAYTLASTQLKLNQIQDKANLSKEMAMVFEKIYGLDQILFEDRYSIFELLDKAAAQVLAQINIEKVKYIIHTHTSRLVCPFGLSIPQYIKNKFQLNQALAFGTSLYKCVSGIKALDILSVLLNEDEYGLILTGEIAFTPELRLIPRSSIAGDAATAVLVSKQGDKHKLIAIKTKLLPGYTQGIYLSEQASLDFDHEFLSVMADIILSTVNQADLSLSDIALILPHNVNYPTWKKIAKAINIPIDKIYLDNISKFGHCFSSDAFLNLSYAEKEKRLKKGDYYLMVACGIGFFFSCAVLQC